MPDNGVPLPYFDQTAVFSLGWRGAVDALDQALLDGLDPAAALGRQLVDVSHGQVLLMPAESATGVGVKVATVAPDNPAAGRPRIQALYLLLDREWLTPLALLDGIALTTLRTPAVSAVAVRHLAAPDAARLVVFGSGPQAWGHVHAVAAVRPIESVRLIARNPAGVRELADRLQREGFAAEPGTAADVAEADVVVCATTAGEPVFDSDLLKPTACVVAVGSHDDDRREVDEGAFARADRVVVETRESAMREAGDVVMAIQAGVLSKDQLIDLGEVVRLQPSGGLTVFKSAGMGWQDLVVAEALLAGHR